MMYTYVHRVYNRCTQVYNELFALAVALSKSWVDLLCNVLVTEVRVVVNDRLEIVVEHNSGSVEITASAYPFSGPHGTDDMRMPVLAGIAVDNVGSNETQHVAIIGHTTSGHKDMGISMTHSAEENGAPDFEIDFKILHEWRGNGRSKILSLPRLSAILSCSPRKVMRH